MGWLVILLTEQAPVFFCHAAVLNHGDAVFFREARGTLIPDSFLHPDSLNVAFLVPALNGLPDNLHDIPGGAEDYHRIHSVFHITQAGVRAFVGYRFRVGIDGDDTVPLGHEKTGDVVCRLRDAPGHAHDAQGLGGFHNLSKSFVFPFRVAHVCPRDIFSRWAAQRRKYFALVPHVIHSYAFFSLNATPPGFVSEMQL